MIRFDARLCCALIVTTGLSAFDAEAAFVEAITVTAQRRPVPLLSLAGNAARVGADEISRVNAVHPAEILNRLPGVYIHRGNGQEHLTAIRSPVLTGGAGAGSFLFLEDGVPLRAAGFANVNGLFEAPTEIAAAIEAVRGPGSALYGSNAVHGLINVITRGPGAGPEGFAEISGGSFERYGATAFAARGQAGAGAALGLVLQHEGGYVSDAGLDQQKAVLRLETAGAGGRITATLSGSNLNQETAGFITGPDAYKDRDFARTNPNPEAYRDARSLRAAVRYERDVSERGTLTITPFARYNEMEFLQHFLPSKAVEENGHWSVGVLAGHRVEFPAGHSVTFGSDIELTQGWLSEVQALPSFGTFPQGVHYDYTVDAQVAAPYLHTEWQLTDDLRATVGIRYEYTHYDYQSDAAPGTNGRFIVPEERTDTYRALTPKLGLSWAATQTTTLYAAYARGARAPQTTDAYRLQTNQDVGGIEEETLDSLELGVRHLGERVSVSLAAFAMDKKHFFFRDTDGFNVPDGKTRHLGVELDGAADLGAGFTLAGAATYAQHTYRFDRPVSVNATESIARGDEVDTAPNWLANVRLLWRPADRFTVEAEWVHVGDYFTDAANLHAYPGHDVFNLRAGVNLTRAWTLSGAVRNVFDEDYAERADYSFGTERYFPGEGRAFELRAKYAYGG